MRALTEVICIPRLPCQILRIGGRYVVQDQGSAIAIVSDSPSLPAPVSSVAAVADFEPPLFGLTVLGASHGFDPKEGTSGYVLWINRRGIMIDPPPNSTTVLRANHIAPRLIEAIIVTHCHADHDAGSFQKILTVCVCVCVCLTLAG